MGLLGNVIDSFKWANMGEKEATARVMEREIKQAKAAEPEGSILAGMNDFHEGKEGTKFFAGSSKNALRTALLDFTHAQQANAVAAGSFMNADIMAVADSWGIDNTVIQNAMAGYQGEVSRAGTSLMNTVATLARQNNGALTTTGGGILSPTEASFLLETIGTWNPEARMALEMENDKGKVMNSIENKHGSDFLDWTDMEKFGRIMDKDGNYTPFEDIDEMSKSEILTGLTAIGMTDISQALQARWMGDDSYINNIAATYNAEIDACAKASGGLMGESAPQATGPRQITEKSKTTQQFGTESETTATYTAGEPRPVYNQAVVAGCIANLQSPFGKQGLHQFEHKIMAARGITKDQLKDIKKGYMANERLWGEDGYIDQVKGHWTADEDGNKEGSKITGIQLKYLPQSEFVEGLDARSLPRYVDLSDKENRYLVALELQASIGKGDAALWQTGSPGSYNEAHWSEGKKPETLLSWFSDDGFKTMYGDAWEYDGEKIPVFKSPQDMVSSTYKGYKDAISGAATEDDMRKALNKMNSLYGSTFAKTRTDTLLNFSMEDY